MLTRNLKFILKNASKNFSNPMKFQKLQVSPFSQKLIDILNSEVNHEETNYSSIEASELKSFCDRHNFEYKQPSGNKLDLELVKTEGDYKMAINFRAKPPIPAEEEAEGEEKSNLFFY